MNRVMVFILISVLLAGCSTASSPNITHVYAFGDEHSDNGNCYKFLKEAVAQGQLVPEDLKGFEENWEGRLSNGPVAVEVMADRLKVPLTDYAVCAAMSGSENINSDIDALNNTGLLGQVNQFESDLKGEKADADALYFIDIGTVDIWLKAIEGYEEEEAISGVADQVIAGITNAITLLANSGAKKFMVGNSFDLSKFPSFISEGVTDPAQIYQSNMNARLPGKMEELAQQLGVEIDVFDHIAAGNSIQSNAEQYGLTNLSDPCTEQPFGAGQICAKPDEYYYWGYSYLTARVHQIMGEAMAEQLTK